MITTRRARPSRRMFLTWLGAGAASLAAGRTRAQAPRKPNLVFILADDLGGRDLACYGHKFHETPRLDALAAQGMRFTDAYAACPVCSPTRVSIMSGQYPAHAGITDFITGHWRPYEQLRVPSNRQQHLPLEITTVAESLAPAGYTSAVFGKWHLGNRDHYPDKQGFEEWMVTGGGHFGFRSTPPKEFPKDKYLADALTDEAVDFIARSKDKPFALFLHHYAVHIPLDATPEMIAKYEAKPKPSEGVNNPIYAAMVEHVDQSVGRVMDALDAHGLTDDTMLVFFSDNGGLHRRFDETGPIVSTNAPLRDEKGSLYEGGIRVPLIVRWPGRVRGGSTCATPVTSVDFFPTFVEVMGGAKPAQKLDGLSLTPLLEERGGFAREGIYWHYPHYHHSTPAGAIRDGDWKLLEFFEDGRLELYNLRDDIGEKKNLAQSRPEKARALQRKLALWRTSINAVLPAENPDYDPARAEEWGTHPDRAPRRPRRAN